MSLLSVKKKLNDEQFSYLKEKFSFPPYKYGYEKGYWTSQLASDFIFKSFKVKYSQRRTCELLNELGFSFKRPRMKSILSDEKEQKDFIEELPKKIEEIKQISEKKGKEIKILCVDEAGFRRDGTLHQGWFLKGETPEIPESNGRFESIKLFGAVDPLSGDFSIKRAYNRITTLYYGEFLIYLSNKYNDKELIILQDNAPWHSKNILEKLFKERGIENIHLIRFPKYSPKMNPCEKLWKWIREDVTHCRYYPYLKELMLSIYRFYRRAWNNKELAKIRFKTEINIF